MSPQVQHCVPSCIKHVASTRQSKILKTLQGYLQARPVVLPCCLALGDTHLSAYSVMVQVTVGARVMSRHMCTEDGLVNGAMGTIKCWV